MPADTPPATIPTRPPDPDATIAPPVARADDTVTVAPGARIGSLPEAAVVPGFAIEGELGRGGMGVVYRARQMPLNRLVALKMVLSGAHADPKDRARFLAEAEAVAAVRHPHVVQVFEFGEHDGRPYFAMEYLDGGSLAGLIQGRGKLPPVEAAALVEKCARGVQAAHDLGIVHRDLKPANILLHSPQSSVPRPPSKDTDPGPGASRLATRDWGLATPKVTDFGLAKRGGQSDLTRTGAVMGTPAYMAPEQAKGEGKFVGPGADVYALGVILYECLAGRPPFRADDAIALITMVATAEAPPVRRFAQDVPRDLDLICRKCLAKGPHERYATAGMLADDLGRFLRGEPVTARPVGPGERVVKWVRRNPVIATAAAAVLVAVLGGSGVALWQAVAAHRAEREARGAEALAQTRLRQQEKANELMLSVFRGLKPGNDGETAAIEKTLGDQLDQVTSQLNETVVEDPLTLAQMRDALGYAQLRLHRLDQAEDLFAKALATREAELGPDHPDTVSSRDGLARVLLGKKKYGKAAELFAATLPAREAALGPGHADAMLSRTGLSLALRELGRKDEANRLLAENVHWYEATLGPTHKRTLDARQDLAVRYLAQKDYATAVPLLEVNVAHYRSLPAPKSMLDLNYGRLTTEMPLARAYLKVGRAAETIALLQPRLDMFDRLVGPDNPASLDTREVLAEAYLATGADAKAIPLLETYLRVSDRMLEGLASSDELGRMAQLGYSPGRVRLARAYDRAGEPDKARAEFAKVEQIFRANLGGSKGGSPQNDMIQMAARHGLAEALVAQKKYAEAEPLLLAVYQELTRQPERDPTELRDLVGWLVEVYAATGKADEKAKWEATLRALPAAPPVTAR